MSREDRERHKKPECSNIQRPQNTKRKSGLKQQTSKSGSSLKMTVQDFVRMDPGYTRNIEHLVFPSGRRSMPQVISAETKDKKQTEDPGKTKFRLKQMFEMTKQIEKHYAEKSPSNKNARINKSVDSILDESRNSRSSRSLDAGRRWKSTNEDPPVRQNSLLKHMPSSSRLIPSPVTDPDIPSKSTSRGPNVSVLHLRSTSEPWETASNNSYGGAVSRTYLSGRSSKAKNPPPLTKHQSLGTSSNLNHNTTKWGKSPSFHSVGEVKDHEPYRQVDNQCNRELSPVRWCDMPVQGVFLGRSGWVQVQQRSVDVLQKYEEEKRLQKQPTKKNLSAFHYNSEPGNHYDKPRTKEVQRPQHLLLNTQSYDYRSSRTPSPVIPLASYSPPSLTPIISPPPAFQDKNKAHQNSRSFFGKTPFLPRYDAIEDSDVSPPSSPPNKPWKSFAPNLPAPLVHKKTSPSNDKPSKRQTGGIPQTKSLEDTSAIRRTTFGERFRESPSSSSSSMGFKSLDSTVNRNILPRLSENTDSSIDTYEDADDEDNSSSLNISMNPVPNAVLNRVVSPRQYFRQPLRKSPGSSDTLQPSCNSSSSSSTESFEFVAPQQLRRSAPVRGNQKQQQLEESIRVRRSRSLQLPEKNASNMSSSRISPQHTNIQRGLPKTGSLQERPSRSSNQQIRSMDEEVINVDLLREAEVVTEYLYGNRSRAAAQALLTHRFNNNNNITSKEEVNDDVWKPRKDGLTVYYVGKPRTNGSQKLLVRGSTTPNIPNPRSNTPYDFWPHCANRDAHYMMRQSQSYPTHQRSLDSVTDNFRGSRILPDLCRREPAQRRVSPNRAPSEERRPPVPTRGPSRNVSPREDACNTIQSRPGSAPTEQRAPSMDQQQRSLSLPKSFLTNTTPNGSQLGIKRTGTESTKSSPGCHRKEPQTAPATPLHESNRQRSPAPSGNRRIKALSTTRLEENRKWKSKNESTEKEPTGNLNANNASTDSVLQKFRKRISRLQSKKSTSRDSEDVEERLSPQPIKPTENEKLSNLDAPLSPVETKEPIIEQRHRFGGMVWRSSKEKKKLNKAARNAKCNSGDSGIHIEMVSGGGCSGRATGGGGDSSESHDTDQQATDETDSPPTIRWRTSHPKLNRPHSELFNQILIDKFKADLKERAHIHQHVRRTRSDLGGQRLLNWDPRASYRRMMSSPAHPRSWQGGNSPTKKPPPTQSATASPPEVQLRNPCRRGHLRRSLSQPIDIDKLSPLVRPKALGLRAGVNSEDEQDMRMGTTSEDETMSDSESSIVSLTERKKSLELAMDEEMIVLAEAVFDHVAIEAEELVFAAGDVIEVLETANRDWWWGSTNGRSGWFPAHFVRLRVSQEDTVEDCLAAMASGRPVASSMRRRTSISLLSNDQVRTSVVRELVHTERDFVKVLRDVADGYISECRKRSDMFTAEQIETIFINLENILSFQSEFLKDLEDCIDWESPYKSCVGSCFLKHKDGFRMYSDYCNSHPMASAALQELNQFNNYSKFFEACRLMRGLIEIPLDGYLLTPVQRICKYPLQLAELLKYTRIEHKDHENIKEALEVMRGVAMLINERKRRMESLEKLAAWQLRVEGWEGEDLIETSSQLIYQGEVAKVTSGMWSNNITLFLFDHQIVYCKKIFEDFLWKKSYSISICYRTLLKRSTYVYKGRICLDTCEVIDVNDGKDIHSGVSVRYAIKLYSCVRDKWLLFCCRSAEDKRRWLQLFAEERKLVAKDRDSGLDDFPPSARHLARMAAKIQRRPPKKPRSGRNFKHDSGYMGSNLQLNSNSNSLGRKVGTWFSFGGSKKTRHQQSAVS